MSGSKWKLPDLMKGLHDKVWQDLKSRALPSAKRPRRAMAAKQFGISFSERIFQPATLLRRQR